MAGLYNARSRGHQGSGPRERRKRRRGASSLHFVKPEHPAEMTITETPLDLQCKFITGPEVCNLQRLPGLENRTSHKFVTERLLLKRYGARTVASSRAFGSALRFIGVVFRCFWPATN